MTMMPVVLLFFRDIIGIIIEKKLFSYELEHAFELFHDARCCHREFPLLSVVGCCFGALSKMTSQQE